MDSVQRKVFDLRHEDLTALVMDLLLGRGLHCELQSFMQSEHFRELAGEDAAALSDGEMDGEGDGGGSWCDGRPELKQREHKQERSHFSPPRGRPRGAKRSKRPVCDDAEDGAGQADSGSWRPGAGAGARHLSPSEAERAQAMRGAGRKAQAGPFPRLMSLADLRALPDPASSASAFSSSFSSSSSSSSASASASSSSSSAASPSGPASTNTDTDMDRDQTSSHRGAPHSGSLDEMMQKTWAILYQHDESSTAAASSSSSSSASALPSANANAADARGFLYSQRLSGDGAAPPNSRTIPLRFREADGDGDADGVCALSSDGPGSAPPPWWAPHLPPSTRPFFACREVYGHANLHYDRRFRTVTLQLVLFFL